MADVTTLPRSRPSTRADLDALPDDGHRYELLDESLVVTPAPTWRRQSAVVRLWKALDAARPGPEMVVDPEAPSLLAWELRHGTYELVADVRVTETHRAMSPTPWRFVPPTSPPTSDPPPGPQETAVRSVPSVSSGSRPGTALRRSRATRRPSSSSTSSWWPSTSTASPTSGTWPRCATT